METYLYMWQGGRGSARSAVGQKDESQSVSK